MRFGEAQPYSLSGVFAIAPNYTLSRVIKEGYTLIRRVRALSVDAGGQIPAAALTAYARDEDRAEALAAGFQMHVAKPIQPEQLLFVVASLAGRIDTQ
ncbi:hypothetical protein [Halotia branconii]|uniref:Response regulatory domain-containing protein n=1 Tax=Halotia branconii CENA392 TaxID=1539056 RepID=A0AAJ6NPV0_9CYAN|nr:hypothetical protein [Halotia branconii]WGV24336.1 hypothetical protein QI031_21460 [Halotia branconii CENA392]